MTQQSTGNHLADAHRQHEEGNASGNAVGIRKHEGHDEGVGQNGRQQGQPRPLPQKAGADGAQKGGQRAEYHVPDDVAAQHIGQQTAHCQSGDGGRQKDRQNTQRFAEPELDLAGVQAKQLGQQGQHHIQGGDDSALGQSFGFVVVHSVSFSFVLGEEGLELTGGI